MELIFDLLETFFAAKNNIIALTSFGIAVGVAFAVSIDVYGLIRSQYPEYQQGIHQKFPPKIPEDQADLHASWHAGLFLGYMIVVNFSISAISWIFSRLPNALKKVIECIISLFHEIRLPDFDQDSLRDSTLLIFGMITILLVWQTYSAKIIENHNDKGSNPYNPLKNQKRPDIKFIYRIIRQRLPNLDRRLDHAVALTVAVDMLAVSTLIRVYFKGIADSGQGRHIDFLPWLGLPDFLQASINIYIFSIIIYNVVYFIARRAARRSQSLDSSNSVNKLIMLRIFEPFVVFAALFAAVPHLIGYTDAPIRSESAFVEISLWLIFALIATLLLVLRHRCRTIRQEVRNGLGFRTDVPERFTDPNHSSPSLIKRLGFPLLAFWIALQALRGALARRRSLRRRQGARLCSATISALVPYLIYAIFALTAVAIFAFNHTVGAIAPMQNFVVHFAFFTGAITLISFILPFLSLPISVRLDMIIASESKDGVSEFFKGFYFSALILFLCLTISQVRRNIYAGQNILDFDASTVAVGTPLLYAAVSVLGANIAFMMKKRLARGGPASLTFADFRGGWGVSAVVFLYVRGLF